LVEFSGKTPEYLPYGDIFLQAFFLIPGKYLRIASRKLIPLRKGVIPKKNVISWLIRWRGSLLISASGAEKNGSA
jgi:hypothetical protein